MDRNKKERDQGILETIRKRATSVKKTIRALGRQIDAKEKRKGSAGK